MLFDRRSATLAPGKCEPLLFADWEAVSFTPFMWDFTYCTTIGMSVAERRATQARALASPSEFCSESSVGISTNQSLISQIFY
jgi:hypothetical protein